MRNFQKEILEAQELHQSGEIAEAKQRYEALLRDNPNNVEILHSLAILFAEEENFIESTEHLQKALKLQPKNLALQLHYANILKIQGLFAQAIEILKQVIKENPNYIPALNNLGTVYYANKNFIEAIEFYRQALEKKPDYVDVYYNLGLALSKNQQVDEAISVFEKLLTLAPNHFAGLFHLACLLMQQNNFDKAIQYFLNIQEIYPEHFETQTNLATCYLKNGALNEAKIHYINALDLTPNDTQVLFNLGTINMEQGHLDRAIQYYQKAVRADPNFFAAHNNLGVAFLAKQHVPFALAHFEAALHLQPENEALKYTINMLSQHQHLLEAPPDYVKSLFNAYADHYESHLLTALDYKVPELLFAAAEKVLEEKHELDILDLGCGTGLCGIPFKDFAKSLTGVDLSEKMLAEASEKNLYTDLILSDLNSFLSDKNEQYDLILAGDVLVYIGDLENLFKKIHSALRSTGIFVFNTEISENQDYEMNQSGRFSHQKKYLTELAKKFHFYIAAYQTVVTRLQNNAPVYGHLFVMKKALLS